jgi:hypothetical protein
MRRWTRVTVAVMERDSQTAPAESEELVPRFDGHGYSELDATAQARTNRKSS